MNFDRKQRFSIRKYSVGVASVLIGSLIMGVSNAAADSVQTEEQPDTLASAESEESAKEEVASVETSSDSLASTGVSISKSATYEAAPVRVAVSEPSSTISSSSSEAVAPKTEEKVDAVKASSSEAVSEKTEEVDTKETPQSVEETTVEKAETKTEETVKELVAKHGSIKGLNLSEATVNEDGSINIPITSDLQSQMENAIKAHAVSRRDQESGTSGFRLTGKASTSPSYEFKKVMTPVLPGHFADIASIEALVVTPENAGNFVYDVLYRRFGYVIFVDEQGNYISAQGEEGVTRAKAARQQYKNDPSDPTRAWTTKLPTVPTGWEIKAGQTVYGYNETKQSVDPNQPSDQLALGRDTKIVIVKQTQKAIINYVNVDRNNALIASDNVAGKSGEAINYSTTDKINELRRKGYELVSDGFTSSADKNFDFDASVDQVFTVQLRERIEPVDPNQPNPDPKQPVDPKDPNTPEWPDSVKNLDNHDDVKRTIHYVYEDGSKAKNDVVENLHFQRFARVNLVTGDIVYDAWTTNDDTFDRVVSPKITGYTADKAEIPAVRGVKAGAADVEETVTYVKDAQKAIIKYVNENGNVELSRDEVAGKSGETIDYSTNNKISQYRRLGYELVNDGFTNSSNKSFDFDASVDQEFVVTLRERIEPVDPDQPKPDPKKPVDPKDPDTPKWPDSVKDIENKESVKRTIHYVYEDGSKAKDDVVETLNYKRFSYVNLVTGAVEYRPWTSNDTTFDMVLTPRIQGYTADKESVPAVTGVKATDPDTEVTVTYVRDAQRAVIRYINERNSAELSRDEVLGKSGEVINYSTADKISGYKRLGYELVTDGFTSSAQKTFDFDASFDQTYTVVLRERIEPVDPDQPKPDPEKPVDPKDPDTPKWPDSVKNIENKDSVTRTVKYVYENGSKASEDVAETLNFKRFSYVNLVTGAVEYRDWTTTDDTFDAVTSPVIAGYTADRLVVAEVTGVKAGTADSVEVVTYVKDAQKALIKYVNVDRNNALLASDSVAGKSGEAIDYSTTNTINSLLRKGYELVSDGFTKAGGQTFDFDASVDQEFTVQLRERIEPVDPDKPNPDPKKPVDPKDPNTPEWPDSVKDLDNHDDVKRTVKYVYADGSKAAEDVVENLHFKRFARVNLVTGDIKYDAWTTNDDTFDAVTSPVIKGYTADKLIVAEVTGVNAGTADSIEVVTYNKDTQKAIIKYVNEKDNKEVTPADVVPGKSGETIDYSTAAKINELRRLGYELVSDGFTTATDKNFDFDASVDQVFTVVVKERVVPVGPNDPNPVPLTPYDPTDPNTPVWPKDIDKIEDRRSVSVRIINFTVEDDEGIEVPQQIRQRITFERTIYVNLVTGERTDGGWQLIGVETLRADEDTNANAIRPVLRSRSAVAAASTSSAAGSTGSRSVGANFVRASRNRATAPKAQAGVSLFAAPTATAPAAPTTGGTSGTVPSVPAPVIPQHYTLDATVPAKIYEAGQNAQDVINVHYKKLGRIRFVDENGNTITRVNSQGNTVDATRIYKNDATDPSKAAETNLPTIPTGYRIKPGQTVYGFNEAAGTVNPNNPADPNAIGQDTLIVLVANTIPRTEVKVVKSRIHYKDAITGEDLAPEHHDEVTFRRVVNVNPETGEVVSADNWVADNGDTTFDAVTSPVIDGYTADRLVVDAVTGLTADSADFVTTVLYRKNATPVTPDTPTPQPEVKPEPKPEPTPQPEPKEVTPAPEAPAKELPKTGTASNTATVAGLGLLSVLAGFGLARNKKED